MPISTYPAASSGSSGGPVASGYSVTATSANTLYTGTQALSAGIYTITCASTCVAEVQFMNGQTLSGSAYTASGTVTVNVGTSATAVRYWADTAGTVITFTLVANAVTGGTISGTLDTITSSTTYTSTSTSGYAYVVVVGGGGGGSSCSGYNNSNYGTAGGGGGTGGVASGLVQLTGSVTATIGTGGSASGSGSYNAGNTGTAGGASSFGGVTANGGAPGNAGVSGGNGGGGAGGTPRGGTGDAVSQLAEFAFVTSGYTGGGRYGYNSSPIGSGIGTGGYYGAVNATGYGAGGAGSGGQNGAVGNGSGGVIYVFRF